MQKEDFDQQVRLEYYRSGVQVTREIGVMALRTLITLNSGAFVVLLTFIGNTAAQSQFSVPLENLKYAMFAFLVGISLSFVAIAYTYAVSQSASPYPKESSNLDGLYLYVVLGISTLSFVAFVTGVGTVVAGVQLANS
ncbi:hypothetical protein [Thioclava sp.]|uniref:hypothetical protein n=1 Tax=Thioclava sp. TaxID=1933450 RepID=UPI003AA91B78